MSNLSADAASVLLVDDHAPNLLALEAVLEPLGQRLVKAESGEEALKRVLQEDFAVILMDVQMAGMDGFETATRIKQRERSRLTPIIFLTATTRDTSHLFKGYEHGAVDFLLKPFQPEILRSKVAVFVELYQAREQLRRNAADALRRDREQSEEVLRRVMESSPLGLLLSDDDGTVLEANDAFLKMVGFTREELTHGQVHWEQLTPSASREATSLALRELLAGGVSRPFEVDYARRDGSRISVMVSSARLEKHRNVSYVLDITERTRAERNLKFLAEAGALLNQSLEVEATVASLARLTVPAIADGCAVELLDPGGGSRQAALAHVNPAKREAAAELRRRFPPDPSAPRGPARVLKTGKAELVSEVTEETIAAMASDPAQQQLLREIGSRSTITAPLVSRGRTLGAITLVSSESRRRFGPQDLSLVEQLAARAALTLENAMLYQEAQRAVRLRDEFLSVASHELKTPLTPLNLRLQALRRAVEKDLAHPPSAERVVQDVTLAEQQIRKLAGLINDLLDVTRISRGSVELTVEEVNLSEVVRSVASEWEPHAARVGCELRLEVPSGVVGAWDRRRLEQVITNLLTNALKYGAGKPVHLELREGPAEAVLEMRDAGIGIASDSQQRIFGRFERAVSDRHYGGLGLGLYITRQWVQALGGEIDVESKLGNGATFRVRLPKRAAASPRAAPPPAEASLRAP